MRIAVVGASGNIGTALLRALTREGDEHDILAIARRPPSGEDSRIRWESADIVRDDLFPLLRGCDAVIHLAWLIQPSHRRGDMHRVNVDGSRRVFAATVAAGVPSLLYSSSVGVYAPGPKDELVDETWPRTGIRTSSYSRDKATVEAILDHVEATHPTLRVVRIRPALVFQRQAATEITRYFLGPFAPRRLLGSHVLPIVPLPARMRTQAVHADDVARAFTAALTSRARGAFNIAAEPVLDRERLAQHLGGRPVPVPAWLLRMGADVTWQLRLQPADAGWVDLGLQAPLMDAGRAHRELGWEPRWGSEQALEDLMLGWRHEDAGPTPVLQAP